MHRGSKVIPQCIYWSIAYEHWQVLVVDINGPTVSMQSTNTTSEQVIPSSTTTDIISNGHLDKTSHVTDQLEIKTDESMVKHECKFYLWLVKCG